MKEGENGTKCRFMVLHLKRVIGGPMRINMCSTSQAQCLRGFRSKQDADTHPDTMGTHTQADR